MWWKLLVMAGNWPKYTMDLSILTDTNKQISRILLIHHEEYDGKLFITGDATGYWGASGSLRLIACWHAHQIKMDEMIGEWGTYG